MREGCPDYEFAFHDNEELGSKDPKPHRETHRLEA
jgi:hypothetical protein